MVNSPLREVPITKINQMVFFLIIGIAIFLRTYHLHQQEIFSYDEGYIIDRAETMHAIFSGESAKNIFFNYIDIKIFWLWLIAAGQFVVGDAFLSAKCLTSFLGVFSVGLTFLLAKRFYRSTLVGLCSAAFLAVSSYHVFYSRMVIPDTCAATFLLLSILCYWMGMERGKPYTILSGVSFGMAFLTHYRVLVGGVYIFIMEFYQYYLARNFAESGLKKIALRYSVFMFSTIIAVVSFVQWEQCLTGISHWAML